MIKKRLRNILTVLGICIGAFSVVITGAVSDIGKEVINRELDGIGVDGISVTNKNEKEKCDIDHPDRGAGGGLLGGDGVVFAGLPCETDR